MPSPEEFRRPFVRDGLNQLTSYVSNGSQQTSQRSEKPSPISKSRNSEDLGDANGTSSTHPSSSSALQDSCNASLSQGDGDRGDASRKRIYLVKSAQLIDSLSLKLELHRRKTNFYTRGVEIERCLCFQFYAVLVANLLKYQSIINDII